MFSASSLRIAVFVFPLTIGAQSVVSVHSGVVHYFEGSVAIDGQPLQQRFGRFEEVRPGSELRTDQGRAELLLTPGVLLRVDENSSIRMMANRLSDTRVEFVGGSVAVDSRNGSPDAPIRVSFRNYEVRFLAPGSYRFDSAPPGLRIDAGEAQVSFMASSVSASANHIVSFTPNLVAAPTPGVHNMDNGLDGWAQERSEAVANANDSAVTSDNLSASLDSPQDPAYGGGYSLGVDPAFLSPGDLWVTNAGILPWGLGNSFSPYPGQLYGYIFVPVYRSSLLGYRSFEPIRRGPYVPPPSRRPLVRTAPTVVRRSSPVVHVIGRR
jgi:hypothetical protein